MLTKFRQWLAKMVWASGYQAARRHRLNESWRTSGGRPDQHLQQDAKSLRFRSGELYRNNPIARSVVNSLVNQALPTEIRPRCSVKSVGNEDDAARFCREINELWDRYSRDPDAFSLTGRLTHSALQRLTARTTVLNGETFLIAYNRAQSKYPSIRFDVVDSERLEGEQITSIYSIQDRAGIEYNEDGRPVSYKFLPRDESKQSVEFPADDVSHVYYELYPGVQHGEPIAAAVGEQIYHYGRYYLAEIQGQETTARIFGVIKSDDW